MSNEAGNEKQIGRTFVSESKKMGIVLRVFSGTSVVLMAAGLVLFAASGGDVAVTGTIDIPPISHILAGALALEPLSLMAMGIVVLLLTPFARVAGASVTFMVKKDWRYALISLGVMIVLVLSLLVPGIS